MEHEDYINAIVDINTYVRQLEKEITDLEEELQLEQWRAHCLDQKLLRAMIILAKHGIEEEI